MITEIKFNNEGEIRLDNFLKLRLEYLSRTKIQKLISNGKIKVDDFIVKPSFILKYNHTIICDDSLEAKKSDYLIPEKMDLEILFEDDHIIAINKSSGVVVHPGTGNKTGTLLNGLMYKYKNNLSSIDRNRPGVIHRLDKYTSGVILFAKTDFSHYSLSDQFAERKIKKKYNALVWGSNLIDGKIENMLTRDPKNRLIYKVSNNDSGKSALTHYSVKRNYNFPITLIDVYPHTGRTHQIRVHMSSIGHSILNDSAYGGGLERIRSFDSKYKSKFSDIFKEMKRVALHAETIDFFHPVEKKQVVISAPLPDDFSHTIDLLETYED